MALSRPAPLGRMDLNMQDYLLLLAKLPFVVAALGWAVRELVVLNREEKRDAARHDAAERDSAP